MTKWYDPVDDVRHYLEKGELGLVWKYAAHLSMLSPAAEDISFWSAVIEAGSDMKADEPTMRRYRTLAERCTNVTDADRGDIARSFALYRIRRREYAPARAEIETMAAMYGDDANRRASGLMVRGVLAFAMKHYDDAVELHDQAEKAWDKVSGVRNDAAMTVSIRQYFINRYHRLRAASSVRNWYSGIRSADHVSWSGREKRDRTRVAGAWFAYHLGRPGIWLFDTVIQRFIVG